MPDENAILKQKNFGDEICFGIASSGLGESWLEYSEFASDFPLHRSITFHSAEENEEAMRRLGIDQQVRQLGRGEFRSDFIFQEAENVALFSDRFNKACSMYLEPPAGTVGFLFFMTAGGQFLASGESVANDMLVVLPEGTGTDLWLPNLAGSEAIAITEARFSELTEIICPTSVQPARMTAIRGNTAELHTIRKAVLDLVARPDLDAHGERLSNLIAHTIAWTAHSNNQWRPEGFTHGEARLRIAKLAQEYIEENYSEVVSIENLCRVTGVGVRTLQRCFREYFQLTITDYLKSIRLSAAHRELVAGPSPQHSVTEIALRYGFTHLGRFSVEFRERFGVSPSKIHGAHSMKPRSSTVL